MIFLGDASPGEVRVSDMPRNPKTRGGQTNWRLEEQIAQRLNKRKQAAEILPSAATYVEPGAFSLRLETQARAAEAKLTSAVDAEGGSEHFQEMLIQLRSCIREAG